MTDRRELVGRESELGLIREFLDAAVRGARPAAVVLEGEPGIGKSTLWQAGVAGGLERGMRVLQARPAETERELSFSALGDVLGPALDRLEMLASPRRKALEVALLLSSGDGNASEPLGVGLATADLLRLLAHEQSVLVAIDDAQWLDPASRQALEYVFRRIDHEQIALLVARRPGTEALAGERVVVGPLSLGALHELLRARTNARVTRPTLVRIHEASGGNPLFALEVARALEGVTLRAGEPLPVPATLADLTASRLERLSAEARGALLVIAALAHPTIAVVAAATEEAAEAALAEAAAAGLVESDGIRVRFTHPLLASALYGAATTEERADVHLRLAKVVANTEERARHLGAATTEPNAEVARALDDAASAARARGAPAAAADLAETAIRLTPAGEPDALVTRLEEAAGYHFVAGDTTRARALLEQALERAAAGPERGRIAVRLASLLDSVDLSAEFPMLVRALREAGVMSDSEPRYTSAPASTTPTPMTGALGVTHERRSTSPATPDTRNSSRGR